jgi:hypothetical protein
MIVAALRIALLLEPYSTRFLMMTGSEGPKIFISHLQAALVLVPLAKVLVV